MPRPDDVVGYSYAADTACPACIVALLPTGEGGLFDGWGVAPDSPLLSTEENLSEIAAAFGINRTDESSFDSGDFPKVIFRSDVDGEICGCCGEVIE